LIVFPNGKINLGLYILDKRKDGLHNLTTVFYPLPLKEALEVIRNDEENNQESIRFSQSGDAIDGDSTDNLCVKAYHLLKSDFPELPAVKMHLHKAIPMGAGLGGGSADAAFALKMLNDKFQLNLSVNQLLTYSLQLGSDCPFFIINLPCLASGRGEILDPVNLSLAGYDLLLINPGIHVNTGWAFSHLNISVGITNSNSITQHKNLANIISQSPSNWAGDLINDFEIPIFSRYPELKVLKKELYRRGAIYAAMSGSGSTLFGLYEKGKSPSLYLPLHYYVKTLPL
jgi:4-diphosphocytidyl-2-C-methyl-D-erythritol kinase